jgi:hypothetical protein
MRQLMISGLFGLVLCSCGVQSISDVKTRRTSADMKTISGAIERTRLATGKLPAVLPSDPQAIGLRTYPVRDGWGEEWVYLVSEDGRAFRLISGGRDRRVENTSRVFAPTSRSVRIMTNYDADIIVQNGEFVQMHRAARRLANRKGA